MLFSKVTLALAFTLMALVAAKDPDFGERLLFIEATIRDSNDTRELEAAAKHIIALFARASSTSQFMAISSLNRAARRRALLIEASLPISTITITAIPEPATYTLPEFVTATETSTLTESTTPTGPTPTEVAAQSLVASSGHVEPLKVSATVASLMPVVWLSEDQVRSVMKVVSMSIIVIACIMAGFWSGAHLARGIIKLIRLMKNWRHNRPPPSYEMVMQESH